VKLSRSDALLGAGAVLASGAFAGALVSQHLFDLQPCPWCVLIRLITVLLALTCAVGLAWRSSMGRRASAGLGLALSGAGIAAALWLHFVAAASASCNLTLADRIMSATGLDARWPQVFAAYASCADAKASLLGVPYELLSVALFLLIGSGLVAVLRRPD